jgi:hypothetical protein
MSPARLLRLASKPSYNTPPSEAPIPFSLRPCHRVPVHFSVTDNAEPFIIYLPKGPTARYEKPRSAQ